MPPPNNLLRDASRALLHSLDPVIWAADVLKFTCDSWQAALLRSSHPQIVLRCSRQSGKTAVTAILAAHQAVFTPGSLVLVTSPSLRQASETSGKIRALVITAGIRLAADAATSITLPNGSRVVSLPASPDAIRGYSAPRLVIEDEAAYIPDELHLALRPMLATGRGRFVLLSTPAAKAGHFYEACRSPDWHEIKVTAHEISRISKSFLAAELRDHGDLFFRREFEAEFCDAEFSFFGSDLIAAAFACDEPPLQLPIFT